MRSPTRSFIIINLFFIANCKILIEEDSDLITTKLGEVISLRISRPYTNYIAELTDPNGELFYNRSGLADKNIYNSPSQDVYVLGPMTEDYQGNWVLSNEFIDNDGKEVEVFKVVTIEIVENVEAIPEKIQLRVGDTYNLKFSRQIDRLQSCQIIPPSNSSDKYYERLSDKKVCAFSVKNVSLEDSGLWQIVAVGDIVFMASSYLDVTNSFKSLFLRFLHF